MNIKKIISIKDNISIDYVSNFIDKDRADKYYRLNFFTCKKK